MYKQLLISFFLISNSLLAQEIIDYKARYAFTNSKVTMEGIRELKTMPDGKRTLTFNARNALGKIKISSEFRENKNIFSAELYSVKAKVTIFTQERVIKFDQENATLNSSGKYKWVKDLPKNLEIFDPLNAQLKIRKMISQGVESFSLLLPEMKTGEIKSNDYFLKASQECKVGEKVYQCKIVQRYRPHEDRTTTYYIAPMLNFLIVRMEDQDEDGDTLLELKNLL